MCVCGAALGGLMFRILVTTKEQGLRIVCVLVYKLSAAVFYYIWDTTAVGGFADDKARIAFDFVIRWYLCLCGEMVFIELDPTKSAFIVLLVLTRVADLHLRTGLLMEWYEKYGKPVVQDVRSGRVTLRQLLTCRRRGPALASKVPQEANAHEDMVLWYARWQNDEQLMLANLMAAFAVIMCMLGEKYLEDRAMGIRILTYQVPAELMYREWTAFSFILFSHLVTYVVATVVYRYRLAALSKQLTLSRRSVLPVMGANSSNPKLVENPLVSPVQQGRVQMSGAVAPLDPALAGGEGKDEENTSPGRNQGAEGGVAEPSRGVRADAMMRAHARRSSVFKADFDFTNASQKFFFRDPVVFTVAIVCCVAYTVSVVYSVRVLQITGRL